MTGAAGAVKVNRTVPRMVSPSSEITCQVSVYGPAGPVAVTGAVTVAPVTVACPTVHTAPPGPATRIGLAGSRTASPKVSDTSAGGAARLAPAAGVLFCNDVWASAAGAPSSAVNNTTSAATGRDRIGCPFRCGSNP